MVENNNETYDLSVSLGDFKLDNPVIPARCSNRKRNTKITS